MKITATFLITALMTLGAYAQTLTVNGEVVEGVTVNGIGFTPGDEWDLSVTTEGGESLVVAGSEPAPEPEPEPAEPVEPDPDFTGDVIRRYHIQDWDNAIAGVSFIIPRGATVASRFTSTDEVGKQGGIYFQSLGAVRPRTDVWISEEAGGEVLNGSNYCQTDAANFTYRVLWKQEQGFPWYCTLQTGIRYYINVKHTDPEQPASTVTRNIY